MRYAAYGSNLHPLRLGKRLSSAMLITTCLLPGWSLYFHKRGDDKSAKCSILAGGGGVYCAIFEISTEDKLTLDRIEGVGFGYSEITLSIPEVGDCASYVAEESHIDDSLLPYDWYHELVLIGARTHGFPGDYLKQIESERVLRDPDPSRRTEKWKTVEMIKGDPMNTSRKLHWENVYTTKEAVSVSWYQPVPAKSLGLIRSTGVSPQAAILDVGGGASTLVDNLLDAGYQDLSVLDIASSAFTQARARLGAIANQVKWIESDVTEFEPPRSYAIWHDRAVFHFLTDAADRERYLDVLRKSLQSQGHFLLATFGEEGPTRCSGLEVQRYSVEMLKALLEPNFRMRTYEIEEHRTPKGATQEFLYSWWQAEV